MRLGIHPPGIKLVTALALGIALLLLAREQALASATELGLPEILVIAASLGALLASTVAAVVSTNRLAREVSERQSVELALRQSQAQFRAVFDSAALGMVTLDLDGRIRLCNPALQLLLGYRAAELVARTVFDLTGPADRAAAEDAFAELTAGNRPTYQIEQRYLCKDGQPTWVQAAMSLVRDEAGQPQLVVGLIQGFGERRRVEEALQAATEKLVVWVDEAEERDNESRLLAELSDLLQTCLSLDEAYAVIARSGRQLFPDVSGALFVLSASRNLVEVVASWGEDLPGERVFAPSECWALRRGRAHVVGDPSRDLPCAHCAADPSLAYLCLPIAAQGETLGVLHLDVTAEGELNAESALQARLRLANALAERIALAVASLRLRETLRDQAIRDPLTGLFNRRYLEETLDREIRRAERRGLPLGVVMIDIDCFKRFNDLFGHAAGDALLASLGSLFRTSIRAEDVACRFGGEEFVLLLPESSLEDTVRRAEEIRLAVRRLQVEHRSQPLGPVTISLGVASYPATGSEGSEVLRRADAALYQAKASGRNRVVSAGGQLTRPGSLTDEIEAELAMGPGQVA